MNMQSKLEKVEGAAENAHPATRQRQARLDLLERISSFAVRYDFEITGVNLAVICSALSGSNGELAKAFATREMSGQPIDQRWLDTVMRLDPETDARIAELEKLLDQMEYSLMRFAQTAKSAQDETSGHREALDVQIEAIEQADSGEGSQAEVDRIISLSRSMLERIAQAETAMARSQAESDRLRQNLAQARMEADIDHLTRLPNRRAFERRFKSAADEARSKGEPLCVAFCDVDKFKSVNDKHGHEAGDRILCAIAQTLSESANEDCFVSRHGGEEFVMLLFGCDKEAAWRKLDGIRRTQADKTLMNRDTGKSFGKITFSGGVAEVTEDVDPRSALIRADSALYQAKEQGRNRIVAI
ncbi:GGDEF domain-containing protein [Erythrobacter crassostreae]|uniref:diguanylate cyclase n=1 Tax=Erythrobacter crassostreae TaxID=2828328 RepID=A0A9X1F3A4_9SPHN|nr:GGDEF domain-containing protein [Erythrobacter crassostrea]MBV7258904.1 GGDEF domain-containing protein [Erythrobacter crassostrea]